MTKWLNTSFWNFVSRTLLRNRHWVLLFILLFTVFMGTQWKYIRFTQTEANLLPNDHKDNIAYTDFLKKFGEEGNVIIFAVKSSDVFKPETFKAWNNMMASIAKNKEVDGVLSFNEIQNLVKNDSLKTFQVQPFIDKNKVADAAYLTSKKQDLLNKMPFYESLLFNKKSGIVRSVIYLKKDIVNKPERKEFVLNKLIPAIDEFKKSAKTDLKVSGMPYIRTLNAKAIISEIGLFIGATLLVTSLIFYFFFRSFRTTMMALFVVMIGVMWSFGFLGMLRYEITVLTALVPSLIVIIGIPNCIFLTNKYHQETRAHGNRAKGLQRVLTKVGTATFITNVTTAVGFATFIITDNKLLQEFGIVTSINIMALFVLSLFVIPIFFSFMPLPKEKHLEHLERGYLVNFKNWIIDQVKFHNVRVYSVAVAILIIGIIGVYKINISGSILEDMPKNNAFFEDIRFFEKEFKGVLPVEILIDTKRKKGVMKISTLKKMEELQSEIEAIPELSKPVSIVNLVKFSKQAYYNGNPSFYDLPNSQEQAFILPYLKNSSKDSKNNPLKSYVDSTGQYARISTFMREVSTDEMVKVEEKLNDRINKLFPKERFTVTITGKALLFQKGTSYLLENLIESLIFALALTGALIFFLFRSVKMIFVALIPNLLPLLATAGLMGYLGIPIKPSTILVFGIAFGLSVDDTIRFLAQYRQELVRNNWKIRKSIFATLNEEGPSMFYTSFVLLFGFSVFTLSDFGGTVALGGLVSITLLFGMLTNLILLPSLVLSLNRSLANEQELKEPRIDILENDDDPDAVVEEIKK
ncbi:efflux RND transporter permease subunit [Flavobacterium difficile]|uniref:MMPL family transporter n=1 Tax=Flavobacterium difficile TaxID=2709659 RepID=A0ABX0I702_9FLAO|nr:MMPL family transporter [Flavobacterium difficile]NHM02964.1 MMPL family transporter [Flavobacterium difficile]